MNNLNIAGQDQRTSDLTTQVFLAYAAEDAPDLANANCTRATAAVGALQQLLSEASIPYWQRPYPWPTTVEPEAAISRAAEACDNYVLVLSPRSLVDACCLQGLLFALSMNKRIVPLLAETVPIEHLPEPLQTLKIIDLQSTTAALGPAARQMLQTLHHDADYHRTHTRLLLKALAWERQRRPSDLLLQGDSLTRYQNWLAVAQGRSHHRPIQLQTLYVSESARHAPAPGWFRRWLG